MKRTTIVVALVVALVAIAGSSVGSAVAQSTAHDHGAAPARLGRVHFDTSCRAAVREDFDRGVAMLHSFWFSAAIETFNTVLKTDPGCAMAHWGIALSWWGNPFGGFRSPQAVASGLAAATKAKMLPTTDREKAYIEAVETLFTNVQRMDQRARTVAYEKAMEAVAAKFPDDAEARIFYALALGQTALPTDKTYANQLKAAAILEREFKLQPQHPGLAHYIIHSFDVPPLAPRALDAARSYAKIAPDAAHALHMPSHTFTRMGLWQESVEANIASAAAARKDNAAAEELHALDYQTYAYLQMAQDGAARKSLAQVASVAGRIQSASAGNAAPPPAGHYAAAAIPARFAIERNAWNEAAQLQVRSSPTAWADAVTHFARALGAARSDNAAAAQPDIERLAAIRDALIAAKDSYWSGQVDIQHRVASALMMFTQGRKEDALAMLQKAADMEDATEKAAVTPGPIKPARELLGEMLLGLNRPADALAAFEVTLQKEPNRYRALHGAARAATAANEASKSASYYSQLLKLTDNAAASDRPEFQEARARSRSERL